MNLDRQDQIRQIIFQRYHAEVHSLSLNGYHNKWQDVLMCLSWTQLTTLSLGNCHISHNNIKILAELQWPNLIHLTLVNNQITAQCIKQLSINLWPSLKSLDLRNNMIQDQGLFHLAQIFKNSLTYLGIQKCGIKCEGIKSMINYHLNLKKLYLSFNHIGNNGIKFLTKSNMPYLQELSIDDCKIGDQGIKHLIKARWPSLSTLQLHYSTNQDRNKIMRDGWQMIYQNDWKVLNKLNLYQKQAILCINCVLFGKMTKIDKCYLSIQNQMLQFSLIQALKNRQILIN